MMCCVFQNKIAVTFASEAKPRLFLACSEFLGKFETRCFYKIVLKLQKKVCKLGLIFSLSKVLIDVLIKSH